MKYNFELEHLNTVLILRSSQGEILNISKKLDNNFNAMSLIDKNIYYNKNTNQYWMKKDKIININNKDIIQEEYIEVTNFFIENQRLISELKKDPLTQIGNVTAATFKEKELSMSKKSCIIAICDVNDFKTINDNYGHLIGDKALQGIAYILKTIGVDNQDCISRIGGDEFFLIFETTNIISILEKMDLAQRRIKLFGEELKIPLSISVGLSFFSGKEDIYIQRKQEADRALYYVKNHALNKDNIAYLNHKTNQFELYHSNPINIDYKRLVL